MTQRQNVAYCVGKFRQTDHPKFLALQPQQQRCDSNGAIVDYPGFNVIVLTWANDINHTILGSTSDKKRLKSKEDHLNSQISQQLHTLTEKACDVIKSMTVKANEKT